MTRKAWSIAAVVLVFGLLVTWELSRHIAAAEPACAVPADRVFSDIEAMGGEVLGTVAYAGANSDTAVVYSANGVVFMVLLHGECYQAGPMGLDELLPPKDKGTPA